MTSAKKCNELSQNKARVKDALRKTRNKLWYTHSNKEKRKLRKRIAILDRKEKSLTQKEKTSKCLNVKPSYSKGRRKRVSKRHRKEKPNVRLDLLCQQFRDIHDVENYKKCDQLLDRKKELELKGVF
jgi:hypothetical protein